MPAQPASACAVFPGCPSLPDRHCRPIGSTRPPALMRVANRPTRAIATVRRRSIAWIPVTALRRSSVVAADEVEPELRFLLTVLDHSQSSFSEENSK